MRRTWLFSIALPVLATALTAGAARLGPHDRCLRAKRLAAGVAARATVSCHAKAAKKGATLDPACLAKAEARLRKAFDRADRKAERRGGCPGTGEAGSVWTTVGTFGTDVAAAIGAGSKSKCDAKKLKAIGSAARGLLRAKAKTKPPLGTEPLARTIAKVGEQIARTFSSAARRDDCGTGEDAPDVAARVARLAGVAGTLRGRILATKRIDVPEAARGDMLANRADLEAQGLTVADDGSWFRGPLAPAPGWLVVLGDAQARTNLQGDFTIDVPVGSPMVGQIFHASSDTFEVGTIALAQLGGDADGPGLALFEIEMHGPCGMNENPQDDAPECHAAAAAPAGRRFAVAALVNPDPNTFPPLVTDDDGLTYPNSDPNATQVVCLDYNGPIGSLDARRYVGYPGSLCYDRVEMDCCENEGASIRRLANKKLQAIAGLDPRQFPGPIHCSENHGGGRLCQELQQGDVAAIVDGSVVPAGSGKFVEVMPGDTRPVTVHNNGCYGLTHVSRLPAPVPLGGSLVGGRFDGTTISHRLAGAAYEYDVPLSYQTPFDCPDSTPRASDTFAFETDGAVASVTFSCVPTTTTTSTSTSTSTTSMTSTTLPQCASPSECPCFWSGSTNAVPFDGLEGDYGEFFRQLDPNAVDGFVVARDESLGHPSGSIVASFVTLGDAPVPVGATGSFPIVVTGELGAEGVVGGYTSLPFETGVGTTAMVTENDGDVFAGTVGGAVFLYDPLPAGTVAPFQLSFRITRDPADSTPDVAYCTIGGIVVGP